MNSPARRLPGILLAASLAVLAAAPAPALAGGGGAPLGGPLMGSTGVVVNESPGLPPLPAHLAASSWLVADATTGQVLAARDPHGRFLPASTLKMLTAVTLLPLLPPTRLVTVSEADAGIDGSKVGLVPHMRYSVAQLFTALLVVSANDAAQALADAAGGPQRTISLMNAEAAYLNADDTVAKTPSGLDAPGESSSAYDLALIGRAALALPAFRHYDEIVLSYMPAPHGRRFQIYTHNFLLTSYPGDIGGKNGYTIAARGTYFGAATRDGHTIIVTLMHATPDFWPMARALLNWGFAADGRIAPVGQLVAPGPPRVAVARPVVQPQGLRRVAQPHKRGIPTVPLGIAALSALTAGTVRYRYRRRRQGVVRISTGPPARRPRL